MSSGNIALLKSNNIGVRHFLQYIVYHISDTTIYGKTTEEIRKKIAKIIFFLEVGAMWGGEAKLQTTTVRLIYWTISSAVSMT